MEKTDKIIKTNKKNYITAVLLLLVTNVLMASVLMGLTKRSLRDQVDQRMLDIVNVAAAQLNGDELEKLTAADEGTEPYNHALETLSVFRDNIKLDYVYCIREEPDGSFTFTIDPTIGDPGEFGSPVVATDALRNAARGTPSVDKKPYTDSWGTFYSAYSPVFDSKGNVAGIVAVDFNSNWFNSVINTHRTIAIVISFVNVICGIILSVLIMSRNSKNLEITKGKLDMLKAETQKLDKLIMDNSIKKLDFLPKSENEVLKVLATGEKEENTDSVYDLNTNIDIIYDKLHKFTDYLYNDIYLDDATGVRNKGAYKKRVRELDSEIKEGTANFCIGFVDINGFKKVNTERGFEAGDKLMYECARMLKNAFGLDNVYHVMGDEFIILVDGKTYSEMQRLFSDFDNELKKYNDENQEKERFSVSKSCVPFDPKKFTDYRHTFIDADTECRAAKALYKNTHGKAR